ncbi:uncharacterized GPI-anchored protein At4g28100 isoform X2 [Solanum pennellii]|uniref:Uncharacterized GPI-anchored protein At4g28100 isoform X1 n=2 Tax=Solanum subgen. Lycopersicon TaxID=49274 RepID=A0ABM1V7A3_SOLPN|nr:uncharacterized GPI-anchored protein At4g28100 isoform X1 [Solanum pennellii]XP_027771621.1 uncharacterized GPI-anchored protein At4g28100 isoform X2 [Solanum pennellii]TMW99970.1 hypothetical protein EJD97_001588 [Solanum chilense]
MSLYVCFFFTLLFLGYPPELLSMPVLPEPDPVEVRSQTFLPSSAPPATIPAFPEQSNVAGCPLDLPEDLYHSVKSACGSRGYSGQVHQTRCCPVLAAWLYSAYSRTALHRAVTKLPQSTSVDMPVLPDDSETCVDSIEKALGNRGIELVKPNKTCDVFYCYCGIRLHPLSCPEAFSVDSKGKLVGDKSVKRLERDCLSNNGYTGLAGCSKCLNSLYQLSEARVGNKSRLEDRTRKMRSRDCQLMGLTWLLNKNRSSYIHTVSSVLRALMLTEGSSDPQSCTLNSDGMPLAVDSSEINDESAAVAIQASLYPYILPLVLVYINFVSLLFKY